ncbi:hypothetical protein Pan153_63320 [Gimesia panareensis]|uniref:Uncharacterized protein n=1 Tax=Gimesia panareensis TaxID=2527978 RepID=A0A518FZ58_9PLAN|nr:hypothetical protein [Gimesia panareensis]QDV21642.1 hypothetical protein Pan153_63320 [Gimesia panareensis]
MLRIPVRTPFFFCCACLLQFLSGQGTAHCADAVPERLIKPWEASRDRIKSLYLKIRYDMSSPYSLIDLAQMTGRVSFVKATEVVAFDEQRQLKRFKRDRQQKAKKDEQGNWTLETQRAYEQVSATEGELNRNTFLPGNIGMQYGKNFYPFPNLIQRSTYMYNNALYVEDPLASPDHIVKTKRTSLPEALKLRDYELVEENEDEFVISWTGKILFNVKQVLTISKKFGYRVKQRDLYLMPQMEHTSSVKLHDFRKVADDVWLPYKVEQTVYRDGKLYTRTTMQVLEAIVNEDVSRYSHFEFAPGTQVTDLSQMTPAQVEELKKTRIIGHAREFTVGEKKSDEEK